MVGVLEMNSKELYDRADQAAENAFLKLVSRFSMALAAPIVAVGLTWFGNTLWQINNSQGEMKGQINVLTQRLDDAVSGKYTANDAARDAKAQSIKDSEQDRRINVLETRIYSLEEKRLNGPH